jgi:esterase/lipase
LQYYQDLNLPEGAEELERYLQDKEDRLGDVRPKAEKTILWADPETKARTPLAFVFLHGYTATRREISPGPELLAESFGANIFFTRFTGHGRTPLGHSEASVEAWFKDALEAVAVAKSIGEEVVVIGASTGATIAGWLGTGPLADQILAHVWVSPNFGPADPNSGMLLWPINGLIIGMMIGEIREYGVSSPLEKEIWDYRHHSSSLIPMMQTVDYAKNLDFSQWNEPVLIFYSPNDTVVNQNQTIELLKNFPAGRVELESVLETPVPDAHILLGEAKDPAYTPIFVQRVRDFLLPLVETGEP